MSLTTACALSDLPPVGAKAVQVDGRTVALVRCKDGSVHAVEDECSHGRVSLSEGVVSGTTIECWLHGSRFDLRTGEPLCIPATAAIHVYPVEVDGDEVRVDVTAPTNA